MIYERIKDNNQYRLIQIEKSELYQLFDSIEFGEHIPIDTETTGLDPHIESVLLVSFKLKDRVFIIDWIKTQFDFEYFDKKYCPIWIAHNAKFDAKMLQSEGYELEFWYCTLVVDQKIYQGADFIRYGLNDLKLRYLGLFPTIDKDIRNSFIGRDIATFEPSEEELLYAADDVDYLLPLMEHQTSNLKKSNPALLEFLLVDGLGALRASVDIELQGFDFNTKRWMEIYKDNSTAAKNKGEELVTWIQTNYPDVDLTQIDTAKQKRVLAFNKSIKTLEERIEKYEAKISILIAEGKTTQAQYLKAIEMVKSSNEKLEAQIGKKTEEDSSSTFNVNSSPQIQKLFRALNVDPLPLKRDKATGEKRISADKSVLSEWLAENPDNKDVEIMNLLSEYVKMLHSMANFGSKYTRFINPVTNRIHTYYWDEGSGTGRYRSGDTKKDNIYPNFQQLPSSGGYRECFSIKERNLCIVDWSGAELTIMISIAQDWTLRQIVEDTRDEKGEPDLHSFFATKVWREIYKDRYNKALALKRSQTELDELKKLCDITINKDKTNPYAYLRKDFKGITFK